MSSSEAYTPADAPTTPQPIVNAPTAIPSATTDSNPTHVLDSVMQDTPAVPPAPAPASTPREEFKVPALPAPKPPSALPADIQQIIQSGAHIDEFPPLDGVAQPTTNYEQVVRDLKAKAGFGDAAAEGEGAKVAEGEDGLAGIEKEMVEGGIVRETQVEEGGMEGVEVTEVKAGANDE